MKKILAIAPYPYLPVFSGGQKFIARFFEHLANHADLTVISVPGNDYSLVKNYKTIPLLKHSFSRYIDQSLYKKIRNIIHKQQIDTVIWEHPYYAWLALKLKKTTGVTTILHTHNIEYQRFRSMGKWWWPILKRYERRFFRHADKIFFISPDDKQFALEKWNIPLEKCIDLPFGIDLDQNPTDRSESRMEIITKHQIPGDSKIFFFNGLLDYKPNLDALKIILNEINPELLGTGLDYKILIAGKNLPADLDSLKAWSGKNVIYTGFISDIGKYYKAADIFFNPVLSGGGIKTKLVESIAYGTTVVSTETGAAGINRQACGPKLIIVKDNDWKNFSREVIANASIHTATPGAYYEKYYWGSLIREIVRQLP